MAQTRCRGKMIGVPLLVLKTPGEKASWIARVSKVAARLPQETRRRYIDVSRWRGKTAEWHQTLGLSGAALVCRVMVSIALQPLLACIDTGATFSLLAERVYEEIRDDLPALRPPQVYLTGAGGESLQVRGAVQADIQVGNVTYSQLLQVGRLEGLDLLLGMDWLTTYGVAIDCAAQTIRMGSDSIQFGRAMAVNSGDLVRMAKTVRVRPRGVQRVACRIEDPGRRGREVLVEGTTI